MKFGVAMWLLVVPVVGMGLALLWWRSDRRVRRVLEAAFRTPLLGRLIESVDRRRRLWKRGLLLLTLAAIGLALARPQWGRNEIEIERTGVDLVVALDVSRSMLGADAGGTNRLAAARQAIGRLVESLGGDRLGMVVFAGEAFVAAPLTRDHTAFMRALDSAGPGSVSEGGSNLGAAIERARDCFERGAQGTRVLLVVSDGEQLQGDAIGAGRGAAAAGFRVHTAGVGSATGARLPARSWGTSDFLKNPVGREVVSRRDEQQLERIAASGSGRYTRIETRDSTALCEWFQTMSAGLPRTTEKRTIDEPRERFQWPLALALGLLAIEWMVGDRRRRRDSRVRDVAGGQAEGNPVRQSTTAPAMSVMIGLVLSFTVNICAEDKLRVGSAWDTYNAGVRDYAGGRFAEAFDCWQGLALGTVPRGLRDPVGFQLGNAQFRLGEPLEATAPEQAAEWWRRSLESYRAVLERSPRHVGAGHNYDLVRERLARLTHRLGLELARASEGKPIDAAIDLLRLSVTPLNEAVALAPTDRAIRDDRDRVVATLERLLAERAAQSEAAGDRDVARNSEWSDPGAAERYQAALDDLAEARQQAESVAAMPQTQASQPRQADPSVSKPNPVAESEVRVQRKLADLLTRMGRREQAAGNEAAERDPDQAQDRYQTALERFGEAQQVQPDHPGAQQGEREVRSALERLHLRRGQQELAQGRERLAQKSTGAAEPLRAALGDFQSAEALNPANPEAKAGAEEARRLLPEALALEGQQQMAAGDRAEARSATEALGRFEQAETSFRQALEMRPGQPQAQRGLEELGPRMARVRERVAREAETAARQNLRPSQQQATLQDLLGQASERDRERPTEVERQRQRGQKRAGTPRNPLDW